MKEWQAAVFVTLGYAIIIMITLNLISSGMHITKALIIFGVMMITFIAISTPLAIRNFYLNHPEYNQYGELDNRKDALSNKQRSQTGVKQ